MPTKVSRRRFLRLSSLTGAGFIIGLSGVEGKALDELVNLSNLANPVGVTPFVLIDPQGGITIFNTKPEIGQGTFQSIPSLIAEELDLTLDQITIRQSGGEKELGADQFAGGSASIRTSYLKYRKVGAAAREMLVTAASQLWDVPASACTTENGSVYHKAGNRSATYQELAAAAAKLAVPKDPKLKDPADFRLLGKAVKRPDVPLKTNGKAVFGI
ncbi:molybdopterin cofactor-binding domain-containing protein, partial [Flavihumibacter sp. CACIAM 22H1]|uniref:molybdopterin cofactor-binding domain-containing protein n=1 Tax=Flavihumibacter sp. CACIAM 22H1 TaxID=1812911 RepID=UPI0025C3D179